MLNVLVINYKFLSYQGHLYGVTMWHMSPLWWAMWHMFINVTSVVGDVAHVYQRHLCGVTKWHMFINFTSMVSRCGTYLAT